MPTLREVLADFARTPPGSVMAAAQALDKMRPSRDPGLSLDDVTTLEGIVRPLLPDRHQTALDYIMELAGGAGPLAFPNLNRLAVSVELIQRLIQPANIRQEGTEFCGPTAFIVNLCRMKPATWAHLALHLARSGRCQLNNLQINPSSGIRNRTSANIAGMAQADWMLIASLRDTVSWDAAHVLGGIMGKSFEQLGVQWEDVERWSREAGFLSVISLGYFDKTNWIENFYTRPAASLPIMSLRYRTALMLSETREQRVANMLRFASEACDKRWLVFILVDDKLGRAIQGTEIADRNWLDDIRASRGQLGSVANPDATKGLYQGAHRALTGDDVGGHVFSLLSLEVGGMYISLTGLNRGQLVTPQLLPKAGFIAAVRGIIAATDSA